MRAGCTNKQAVPTGGNRSGPGQNSYNEGYDMRTAHTTADVIERLAYHTNLQIEMTRDAAYLTVGDITWIAPLPKVTA